MTFSSGPVSYLSCFDGMLSAGYVSSAQAMYDDLQETKNSLKS